MKYKFLLAILFISASIFAGKYAMVIKSETHVAKAAATDPLLGWMWMDNVGWISLSSNNDSDPNTAGIQVSTPAYGVFQDPGTLELSGHAWSPLVGWIEFSPTSCPPGTDPSSPCGAQVVSGELVGFAEFLTTQPWWDPYISFSSTNDHDGSTSGVQASSVTYGTSVNPTTGDISGYGWHSNGGWLSFVNAKIWPGGGQTGPIVLKATDISSFLDDVTIGFAPDPHVTAIGTPIIRLTWMKDPLAPAYTTCSITSSVTSVTTPENCPTSTNPLETIGFTFNGPTETYTLTASDGVTTDTTTATVNDTSVGGGLCSVNATWQVAPSCPPGTLNYVAPKMKWWTNLTTTSCTAYSPNTSWMTVSPTAGLSVVQTFNTPPTDGDVYKVECTDTSMNTCLSPGLPVAYLSSPAALLACNTPVTPGTPQCSDGIDNDGDGMVDFVDDYINATATPPTYPGDPGADGIMDVRTDINPAPGEDFQTDNIVDNTGPGPWILDSYADTGCVSFTDNSESRNNVIIKEK